MKSRSSCRPTQPRRITNHRVSQLRWETFVLPALVAAAPPAHAFLGGSQPPAWLQAQLSAPTPDHDPKATDVELYSEVVLTVQPNGAIKRLTRDVYRILRPDSARGFLRLDVDRQTKITALRGWSIPTEGKPYEVKEDQVVDSSLANVENGELMGDVRTKILHLPAAIPGSIVGYEVETDEKPYVLTDDWEFDETVPVREAHYTLQLPPGWGYKAAWLNHTPVTPLSDGKGQTQWLLKDLKAIRVEDQMPPWRGIAGQLVIALEPPDGRPHGFENWQELGAWYADLTRGRMDASPAIKQKVSELTAAQKTSLAKMQALASYVQNEVRYVAIELGIGGMQPHPAADVFAHSYGDCKDKATLLGSMLKEIGVDSYYFIVNTDRGTVTESTPANLRFNHAILVIKLPPDVDTTNLPATITHPKLGKILFFDPTDELVPFGRLSGGLQANAGILVAPEGGELIKPPLFPTAASGVQRTAKLSLDEKGTLHGDIHEVWIGDMAARQRRAAQLVHGETERIKPVESIASRSFSTYQILKANTINARINDRPFEWNYSLEVTGYAKSAGGLLLVRPRVLGTLSSGFLETPEPREYPIEFLGTERDTDDFEIAVPAGYTVDELPAPVNADYDFASYHSKAEQTPGGLRYTRTFEVKQVSVPVAQAEKLKELYRIIATDERNSAVLKPDDGSQH